MRAAQRKRARDTRQKPRLWHSSSLCREMRLQLLEFYVYTQLLHCVCCVEHTHRARYRAEQTFRKLAALMLCFSYIFLIILEFSICIRARYGKHLTIFEKNDAQG